MYFYDDFNKIDFSQNIVIFSGFGLILMGILQLIMFMDSGILFFVVIPSFMIIYAFILLSYTLQEMAFDTDIKIKRTFRSFVIPEISKIEFICWGEIIFLIFSVPGSKIYGFYLNYYNDHEQIVKKLSDHNIAIDVRKFSLIKWFTHKIFFKGKGDIDNNIKG